MRRTNTANLVIRNVSSRNAAGEPFPHIHETEPNDDALLDAYSQAVTTAAAKVNAVIGSHTIRGSVVRNQLDIIERAGYTAERFIWIHAQAEPDFEINLEVARRGAWIEYDGIGGGDDDMYLDRIRRMLDAGLGDHVLLSHDRGWYDPAQPGGGIPKPFTYLSERFLPKLRQQGVGEPTIHELTQDNPFRAFARS